MNVQCTEYTGLLVILAGGNACVMGIDTNKFKDICSRFATGVTVVTTMDSANRPWGLTVTSFTSLSLDPLLILFNIGKKSGLYNLFMSSDYFAINILSSEQEQLSRQFACQKQHRFAGVDYYSDVTGCPILVGCHGYFEAKAVMRYDGGDHSIVIGQVLSGDVDQGKRPLLYYGRQYLAVVSDSDT